MTANCCCAAAAAEYADLLRAREKELGIQPDPEIDALLKASAVEGKRSNIVTDLMLRVLGLEVRRGAGLGCVCAWRLHNAVCPCSARYVQISSAANHAACVFPLVMEPPHS
jgi:hypothetical protein